MSNRVPWFMLGVAAFLAAALFAPSAAPFFISGDARLHLMNASRMLAGQIIYRDFFQFTTPGTELIYFLFFKVCGERAWIPNVVLLIMGLGLVWISVGISRRWLAGWAGFLPGFLFITVPFFHGLDPSHHWFSLLVVMLALAVMEERTPRRVATAGMLCGLAAFFTQSRGLLAYAGFAIFLVWEYLRKGQDRRELLTKQALLATSFFATVLATNAYFIWKAGLSRFLSSTVSFMVHYYPASELGNTLGVYLVNPPRIHHWYALPWVLAYLAVHVLVPGTYFLFGIRYWKDARRQPQHPWDRLMLINITGLFLFISVAPAPSYFRLCVVSLPALILFVWLFTTPGRTGQMSARLIWTVALLMAVFDVFHVQHSISGVLDLPSGPTAFLDRNDYEEYKWLSQHTRPADYFLEAGWANTYTALNLRSPAPVPFVTNYEYTRPEQVRAVVEGLEVRCTRLVLWSVGLDIRQSDSSASDHLGPLRADLRTHYCVIKSFANGDQVWERTH